MEGGGGRGGYLNFYSVSSIKDCEKGGVGGRVVMKFIFREIFEFSRKFSFRFREKRPRNSALFVRKSDCEKCLKYFGFIWSKVVELFGAFIFFAKESSIKG